MKSDQRHLNMRPRTSPFHGLCALGNPARWFIGALVLCSFHDARGQTVPEPEPQTLPEEQPGSSQAQATPPSGLEAGGEEQPIQSTVASSPQVSVAASTTGPEEPKQGEKEDAEEDEKEEHEGFLFRMTLGLGYSRLDGAGTMDPLRGLRRIDDPEHESPGFNFALDFGGGFKGFGLHLGVLLERMILRDRTPTKMGVTLFGVGGGLSYYFTSYDFYATAQARLIGMMAYLPETVCDNYFVDKYEWYRGPGFSLTLGKEWFGDDDSGVGLGLQGNYAYLWGHGVKYNYLSILLVLTVTRF